MTSSCKVRTVALECCKAGVGSVNERIRLRLRGGGLPDLQTIGALGRIAWRCVVLRCIALRYAVLYCVALCCVVLRGAVLRCVVLRCAVLHCIALCCVALRSLRVTQRNQY